MPVAFHVTPAHNLPSILTRGLVPAVGPRSRDAEEVREALYLFATRDDVENALLNWLGDCFEEDEDLVILELAHPSIPAQPEDGQFELVLYEALPPEALVRARDEEGRPVALTM